MIAAFLCKIHRKHTSSYNKTVYVTNGEKEYGKYSIFLVLFIFPALYSFALTLNPFSRNKIEFILQKIQHTHALTPQYAQWTCLLCVCLPFIFNQFINVDNLKLDRIHWMAIQQYMVVRLLFFFFNIFLHFLFKYIVWKLKFQECVQLLKSICSMGCLTLLTTVLKGGIWIWWGVRVCVCVLVNLRKSENSSSTDDCYENTWS